MSVEELAAVADLPIPQVESHDRVLAATHRAAGRHFWFRGFRGFVRQLLDRATEGVPHPRLLDCGCGTAAHMQLLSEFGRAFGFDLTWGGLQLAPPHLRRHLAMADAVHIPFLDESFDVVSCFDVLTCLDEQQEASCLREVVRLLRPRGALLVNVAAFPMLAGELAVVGGERRRYTRAGVRERVESAGLHVEVLKYTNFALFPVMLAVRSLQRRLGLATSRDGVWDMQVPPMPANEILAAALAVERWVFAHGSPPFGTSVLCLARKVP